MNTGPPPRSIETDVVQASTSRCRETVPEHQHRLVGILRALHAEPELAFEEHRGVSEVVDVLRSCSAAQGTCSESEYLASGGVA